MSRAIQRVFGFGMSETRNVTPKSADPNILDDGSVLQRAPRDSRRSNEEVSMERFLYACVVSPFQGEIGNNIFSIETGVSVPGKPHLY